MCSRDHTDGATSGTRQVLPANVKPSHYDVTIQPDNVSFKFTGTVKVSLDVNATTRSILANVNEVEVTSCSIVVTHLKSETKQEASISYHPKVETVTFDFQNDIPAGSKVLLTASFTGIHNDKMAGFYRSGYTENGEKKHLVVTQCEATDCRRIFPCWDEPNQKATFDVTLNVAPHHVALSNMNVVSETAITIDGKDMKCVKFARTPVMSPYVLSNNDSSLRLPWVSSITLKMLPNPRNPNMLLQSCVELIP
jgi:aminopeptidase 2